MKKIMQNKMLRLPFFIMILALISLSCSQSDNPAIQRAIKARKNKSDVIKIAAASPWGQERNLLKQGIELAKEEINSSGGLLGKQLEILYFDDDNSVNKGQSVAYQIASDEDIIAILGHSASSVSISNALLYHYYGILMLSPLSTSSRLTKQGFSMIFRNIPTDNIFGQEAANLCNEMDWNKVLIYYVDNAYGEALANSFELQCSEIDLSVEDRASFIETSPESEYMSIASLWLRNYDFDAIYLAGIMPQAGEIISAFRRMGIDEPIIGGDAFDHPLLLSTAGEYAENVYAVTIFDPTTSWEPYIEFQNNFEEHYGCKLDQAALQGYDALMVLAEGIRSSESTEPAKIAMSLRQIEKWNGPAGPYRFAVNGDVLDKSVTVKVVQDGEFIKVW